MDKALAQIGKKLAQTLCVVISKSGGTKETRNGMLEAEAAYRRAGLGFAQHAVAVTGAGSELALMWHYLGQGKGEKDMVVLPYKDRLELFSRCLQQLVMESPGKELDRDGRIVNQGLAVYGNKG